ncbi:DUF1697 domain-containing protein [Lutibacter citreus]|uniref:DUF1697 domain-containing protein n=1 Tax=Lutibacter citreus TaxID=2138210 RepID=UPI000DBE18EB|nr:DUF1697 domain-containing protein [Lutibacter citreus]
MPSYIALLRGINVSGKNIIKMAVLRTLLESVDLKEVTTYIQSGNILFKSKISTSKKIEKLIFNTIKKHYDYDVNVLVLSNNQLELIFNSNPFLEQKKDIEISHLYVTLLNNRPNLEGVSQIENLIMNNDDEFIIKNKTIYLYCPNGYGKTKLNNNLFERKLNSSATSRNWKTITKLTELSNK